jgi:hypothetical protein
VWVTQHFGIFFHWIAKLSTKLAQIPPYPAPADLQSYWYLNRFGHETLHDFELRLKNQDTKTYITTLGPIKSGQLVSLKVPSHQFRSA